MGKPVRVSFVLHEQSGGGRVPIDDVGFGALFARLGDRRFSHALGVEYRRTQEIELAIALVIGGAGMFAGSYLKTLGQELAKWTVEELKRRRTLRSARIETGRRQVSVSRSGEKKAAAAIGTLLAAAARRKSRIEIVFEERRTSGDRRRRRP